MSNTKAYSAASATSPLGPHDIPRRDPTDATSRSTSSTAASATPTCTWCATSGTSHAHRLPVRARATRSSAASTKVGAAVTKFKDGDLVGVGCMVDSGRTCPSASDGLEQYCRTRSCTYSCPTGTLGGRHLRRLLRAASSSTSTSCCASRRTSTPPARRRCSAPASRPTRRCATGTSAKGKKVGVVGLGGLGHMGVKFAHAFGAHVVVSPRRRARRRTRCASAPTRWWCRRNADEMKKHAGSFDFILDTVSRRHDVNAYLSLLAARRQPALVGAPEQAARRSPAFGLIMRRRSLVRLADRRHRGDAGDARLLRRARHHRRRRGDPDPDRSTRPTSGCSSAT